MASPDKNMTKMVRQTLRKAGWAVMALLWQPVHCQPADQGISLQEGEKPRALTGSNRCIRLRGIECKLKSIVR